MSENRPPPRRRIAGESTSPAPAKKAPVKRAPAKKSAAAPDAKKAPAKKAPAKKAATSTTAKKASAKKAPANKVAPTEAPAQKAAPKKAPAQKIAPKKAVPKKAVPKKAVPKKTAATATDAGEVEASRPQVARPTARSRPTQTEGTASERSTYTVVAAALAALVLVAGAVIGWFGLADWRGESANDARSEAVATASKATERIFSFTYDKLDEHATESKSFMTAKFAKEFDTIAPALTDIAPQRKVSVEAVTRNAAVLPCGDECSPNRASVLVFVDQDRRILGEDSSTVFGNRIEVDLRKTDGDWKVNDIRAL